MRNTISAATARPSASAQYVAMVRAALKRPQIESGDHDGEARLYADLNSRNLAFERFMRARTAFFDGAVLSGMAQGIGQIVVLGAGYDGRSLRFKSSGARYFELDLAETQQDKIRRLDKLAIDREHIDFVPCDFTSLGADPFEGTAHDPGQATLYLCEGVLLYLPEPTISALLTTLRRRSVAGSVLAVSFALAPRASGSTHNPRPNASGESRQSLLTPSASLDLLAECGWRVESFEHPDPTRSLEDDIALFVTATPSGGPESK